MDVVRSRIELLRGYLESLEELKSRKEEFFTSLVLRMAVERLLQLSIECLLDIAQHVAAAKGQRPPESYADTITVLEEAELISSKRADVYRRIARFRNILVHGYMSIDPENVYNIWIEGLEDLRGMARDLLDAAADP